MYPIQRTAFKLWFRFRLVRGCQPFLTVFHIFQCVIVCVVFNMWFCTFYWSNWSRCYLANRAGYLNKYLENYEIHIYMHITIYQMFCTYSLTNFWVGIIVYPRNEMHFWYPGSEFVFASWKLLMCHLQEQQLNHPLRVLFGLKTTKKFD